MRKIVKRLALYLLGLMLMALGITLLNLSDLGTTPLSSIPYVLSRLLSGSALFTFGRLTLLFHTACALAQVAVHRRVTAQILLQIPLAVVFSALLDLFGSLLSLPAPPLALRLALCAAGVALSALLLAAKYRPILTGIDWSEVLDLKPLKTFFIINRDIILRTFCIVAVYTFFTGASARMDDPALLAVNTLLLQLFTLFSYMNDGFAYAAEALTGRFIGARDSVSLRDCLRRCIAWGTLVSVVFVGIYLVWWRDLVGVFVDHSAPNAGVIEELAGRYIVWIILIPIASAMPFIMDGIMVGATETRVMRDSMFWATAAYFAIYYACYPLIGNNALWLAFTLYMFLRGVIQYFMTRRLKSILAKAAV